MTLSRMKIKAPVPFPAGVVGTGGISVGKQGGVWTIEPDFDALATLTAIADPNATSVWVLNSITGVYGKITLAALLASVAQTGAGYALAFVADLSSTADADPGNGKLRFDSVTQNAASTLFVDLFDNGGTDVTAVLDQLDDSTASVKGQWSLTKIGDATRRMLGTLSAVTTASGYRRLSIAVAASSSASPFANGDVVLFCFTRSGDSAGGNVTGPGSATDGQIAAFSGAGGTQLQACTAAQVLAFLGLGATPGGPNESDPALQRDAFAAQLARSRFQFHTAQ